MMEVKVCKSCKKMFQYIAGPVLCPKCKQLEEEYFQQVKEYLREHPGDSLYEVSKQTGVSAALIEKFLRQGRLQVAADSPIELTCERCGSKIITGKYCNSCKTQITNELNEAKQSMIKPIEKKPQDTKERMRFLQSNNIH